MAVELANSWCGLRCPRQSRHWMMPTSYWAIDLDVSELFVAVGPAFEPELRVDGRWIVGVRTRLPALGYLEAVMGYSPTFSVPQPLR